MVSTLRLISTLGINEYTFLIHFSLSTFYIQYYYYIHRTQLSNGEGPGRKPLTVPFYMSLDQLSTIWINLRWVSRTTLVFRPTYWRHLWEILNKRLCKRAQQTTKVNKRGRSLPKKLLNVPLYVSHWHRTRPHSLNTKQLLHQPHSQSIFNKCKYRFLLTEASEKDMWLFHPLNRKNTFILRRDEERVSSKAFESKKNDALMGQIVFANTISQMETSPLSTRAWREILRI